MTAVSSPTPGSAAPLVPSGTSVVLYDGVCGLCDRYVQFVLKRDKLQAFRFAPLQGAFAGQALRRHGLAIADTSAALGTMVLLEGAGTPHERVRVRSDAVLAIVTTLGGLWRLAAVLRIVPTPLRDLLYRLVARVRYRIFGTIDSCSVAPAAIGRQGRFLD